MLAKASISSIAKFLFLTFRRSGIYSTTVAYIGKIAFLCTCLKIQQFHIEMPLTLVQLNSDQTEQLSLI